MVINGTEKLSFIDCRIKELPIDDPKFNDYEAKSVGNELDSTPGKPLE